MSTNFLENNLNSVAEQIIFSLERDRNFPWSSSWDNVLAPYNAETGIAFKGFNRLLLALQGYSDPRWLTYQEIVESGYSIEDGIMGTSVAYMSDVLTFYTLYNAEVIEGIEPLSSNINHRRVDDGILKIEKILDKLKFKIKESDVAYYDLNSDTVFVPSRANFRSKMDYYLVLLREILHWTGHPNRLARNFTPYGSDQYVLEELRAEIALWRLMQDLKLKVEYNVKYLKRHLDGYLRLLKRDRTEIYRAAGDAEKMGDFLLNFN